MSVSSSNGEVLVVDDDPGTRYLFRKRLEAENFTVREAEDGQQAYDCFLSCPSDAILMDVEMPGENGHDVCRRIRESHGGKHIPIVMVTGLEDANSVDLAYQVGATDFIIKPVNLALLGHRLRYILRNAGNVRALEQSEAENRALLGAIPDSIFLLSADGRIIRDLSEGSGGCDYQTIPPQNWRRSDGVKTCLTRLLMTGDPQSVEHQVTLLDGSVRFCESRLISHEGDQILAVVRDISERKRAEARIQHLAYHDSLTELPNSLAFKERLTLAVVRARRTGGSLAVLYIDLDRFKRINDTLGHGAGDSVLLSVTSRLNRCIAVAKKNLGVKLELARLGGDEFVLLISNLKDEAVANTIAKTILASLAKPFNRDGHEFVVTSSIGIAVFPRDGDDMETLLQNADSAMYRAKQSGRNSHKIYNSFMNSHAAEQFDLENDLRCALDEDQLEVYFQPKVDVITRELKGAEALLRWFHPERGEITPSVFIPLAEETGLIVELGRWLAEKVASKISDWRQLGHNMVPIAINVSGHEFARGEPATTIPEAARDFGIPANLIEVEITETAIMNDMGAVKTALCALKKAGCSLAVDDFGTGYSSLKYLKSFPIDVLKIDRSFIEDLENDADSRSITRGIIALAHSLNLKVVAEGVETEDQLNFLQQEGCDLVQGLLLGQPVGSAQFERVLQGGLNQMDTIQIDHLSDDMIHRLPRFVTNKSEVA